MSGGNLIGVACLAASCWATAWASSAEGGDVPVFGPDLEIVPTGIAGYDGFGLAVDWIDDSRVVVGAPGDDSGGDEAGAVWILDLDLDQQPPILASASRILGSVIDAQFGESVMAFNGYLVVGSPLESDRRGAVRILADDGNWSETQVEVGVAAEGRLGACLAGAGTTLAIGAPGGNDSSVLLLEWLDGEVVASASLASPDTDDRFGVAVSVSEYGPVAVGAPGFDGDRGRVHIFVHGKKGWMPSNVISGQQPGDRFGEALCFCGDRLAIGAPGAGSGDAGEVFLLGPDFEIATGSTLGSQGFETGNRLAFDPASGLLGVGCTGPNYSGGVRLHRIDDAVGPLVDLVPNPGPGDFELLGRGLAIRDGLVFTGSPFRTGTSGTYAGSCFLAGTGLDCDLDGVEDAWEIASGTDDDCDGNGVLDACDLGFVVQPRYERHDGTSEKAEGSTTAGTLAWMERFTARPDLSEIAAVEVVFGEAGLSPSILGQPVEVCLWSDPDGDGAPGDAMPLATVTTFIEGPLGEGIQVVDLPSPISVDVGSDFFVGVVMVVPDNAQWYPASIDDGGASYDSWIARDGRALSPSEIGTSDLIERLPDTGSRFTSSRWMITAIPVLESTSVDCDANGVIDSCEIADGSAPDCNGNGSIDSCDVSGGSSEDRDGNGIPDECQEIVVLEVPLPFPTINDALDVARDGDRILVGPGTYFESVDFDGRAIEIVSSGGAEVTTLDGTGLQDGSVVVAMNAETPASVLQGFTITNGVIGTVFPLDPSVRVGGGLFAYFASPTITDCILTGNNAAFGGGAYLYQWDGILSGCDFIGNDAAADGGGLQLSRCDGLVTEILVSDNTAIRRGGGMHVFNGSPTIELANVTGNRAVSEGGGVSFASFNGTPRLIDSSISKNQADILGGGVFIDGETQDPEISGTVICDNTPDDVYGSWTDQGGNTICFCDGDLNLDGEVSASDLGLLLANWENGPNFPRGDLNGDGEIGPADLGLLLSLFGPCF